MLVETGAQLKQAFLDEVAFWQGIRLRCAAKGFSKSDAATLRVDLEVLLWQKWEKIDNVLKKREFLPNEDEAIDVFDAQLKAWGRLFKHLHGPRLGGDYGHIIIEHTAMLLYKHRSISQFNLQGFEASHKLQRQLWQQATSHDATQAQPATTQLLRHVYALQLLNLRRLIEEALKASKKQKKKRWWFRACGWRRTTNKKTGEEGGRKKPEWTEEDLIAFEELQSWFASWTS